MYIQKRNLLVSALCSDVMLQSNLPNIWTPQGKSQVSTLQGCLLQSNVLNTDTKGTEPNSHITDRGACITVKPP